MVAHPVTTAEGVGSAIAHPVNTGTAIASGVAKDWNSGARGQGEVVGDALLAIGTVLAPGAEAGTLSKVGDVANAGEDVEQATVTGADANNVNLTPAQQAKLKAFNKNLPNANTGTSVDNLGDQVLFTSEVPGRVPGSKAIYQKSVDNTGKTTSMLKTTLDPKGNVVHIKDKLVPTQTSSN